MKVLYILGRGRSGSTILANVLGEIPGFFSAGEIRYLWDPVVTHGGACGCGAPIHQCEVWSPVLDRLSNVDLQQVVRWQHEVVRERNFVRLLRANDRAAWSASSGYADVMDRVYRAIQEVTGCSVIVDSSKRPSYGAFIRALPQVDPHFLHLARDPRASAYSWQSRRYESARGGEVKRRNAFDSTVRWDILNLSSEALLKRLPDGRGLRLRYEDFATDPRPTIEALCRFVGEVPQRLPFTDDRTVTFSTNHTIAGNPSRFKTGELEIRDSAEWQTDQALLSRWTATAVALPFLRRYRYPLKV